ncbi:DNA-3-methyladenine glycosylase I [Pseudoalteromonas denitrificans]|uniref:DNA-3-methyladenine glycosylase I n=1 Tax=Pseudoalteromonas denitrificans DSM 6059 TaxID=1123010 RepID=A0A1I1HP92_9GAMM|nr:DNA-3-methyladenine glycosylase I [Pseudoalteromonas denitrificans]SFC23778.1 DNA-3-methyladenine glycosylase I [Pseudoalteromonas denitrificans DSM 6059]
MCEYCPWLDMTKPDYVHYHDEEWGVPLFDDQKLFEFITLESAQAGLSWYTILMKRDNYRLAFDNFNPNKISLYDDKKVLELLGNSGIIRNKLKIRATINNAAKFLEIQKEFGSFAKYQWQFVNGKPIVSTIKTAGDYVSTSKESEIFAKDLKKRGFKFLGPTTVYAHMQACGMVNDHSLNCHRRAQVLDSYKELGL